MIGGIVVILFFVFLFLMAKGLSDFSDHNRRIDTDIRSHALELKLDFDRREYWANNKIPELPTGPHCRVCGKPQTEDRELRFMICRECAERSGE